MGDYESEGLEESRVQEGELFEWIKCIIIAIVIALLIKTFIFNSTYVIGSSMYPTLNERDRLISLRVPLYYREPERGDIVVIEAPDDPSKDYIKRVIGVAGDKIEIIHGNIYINGDIYEEDYIEENAYTHTFLTVNTWNIGEDEIFVLGDNRAEGASKDSRYFGNVKINKVKGIANFRYYPFTEFGKVD